MAYVQGELGIRIKEVMDKSDEQFDAGEYKESIITLEKAWELLPDGKNEYDESYLIVWGILLTAMRIHDTESMKKWIDKIFDADPSRAEGGEREMWAGKVAYETGDLSKAEKYFKMADKISGGRCFSGEDQKYIDFYMNKRKKLFFKKSK